MTSPTWNANLFLFSASLLNLQVYSHMGEFDIRYRQWLFNVYMVQIIWYTTENIYMLSILINEDNNSDFLSCMNNIINGLF